MQKLSLHIGSKSMFFPFVVVTMSDYFNEQLYLLFLFEKLLN